MQCPLLYQSLVAAADSQPLRSRWILGSQGQVHHLCSLVLEVWSQRAQLACLLSSYCWCFYWLLSSAASPRCSSTICAGLWQTSRPELISYRAAMPWIRCSQLQVTLIGRWETPPKTLAVPLPAAARGDGRWFHADPRQLAQLYKMSLINYLGHWPADCALLLYVPVLCLPCCLPMNSRMPDASFGLRHVYFHSTLQHVAWLDSRSHRYTNSSSSLINYVEHSKMAPSPLHLLRYHSALCDFEHYSTYFYPE
jgi:hypothetical protein